MEGHGWRIAFQARHPLGHVGATSGPRATGSQRTTPVNTGPPSAEVTGHTPPPAAGRRDPPEISDTEEVLRYAHQTRMLIASTRLTGYRWPFKRSEAPMQEENDQPRGDAYIYALRDEQAFLQPDDDEKPEIIAEPPP